MKKLPAHIKQSGYVATRDGSHYIVKYMSSGHIPFEEHVELTIEEMEAVYNNYDKWNEIIVLAKARK